MRHAHAHRSPAPAVSTKANRQTALYGDMRKFTEPAPDWPGETKAKLLELAKDLLAFIDASVNKKLRDL